MLKNSNACVLTQVKARKLTHLILKPRFLKSTRPSLEAFSAV